MSPALNRVAAAAAGVILAVVAMIGAVSSLTAAGTTDTSQVVTYDSP